MRHAVTNFRHVTGRRAVQHLPRSYKLWKRQWEFCLRCCQQVQQASAESKSGDDDDDCTAAAVAVAVQQVIACMEQALVTLSHFPRVWMVYLDFLWQQLMARRQQQQQQHAQQQQLETTTTRPHMIITVTFFRRTVNRALQALPVTQHDDKLWKPILLPALLGGGNGETEAEDDDGAGVVTSTSNKSQKFQLPAETAACLLQRYGHLQPQFVLKYAAWCERHELFARAAVAYHQLLLGSTSAAALDDDDDSTLLQDVWHAFGTTCSQHAAAVEAAGVPWRAVLRQALEQQQQQQQQSSNHHHQQQQQQSNSILPTAGLLYSWLANAWVVQGEFELAAAVYEEGLGQVATVRDFSNIFQAYMTLQEGLLEHAVAAMDEDDDENEDETTTEADAQDDWDILLGNTTTTTSSRTTDMEWSLARAEHLTQRRPLLLNQCKLRQDATQINEWLERANLFVQQQQSGQAAAALVQGLQQTANHANQLLRGGSRSELVLKLVELYNDDDEQTTKARDLLQQICGTTTTTTTTDEQYLEMTTADDLAACWACWIELELRHEQWDTALQLARQSVAGSSSSSARQEQRGQQQQQQQQQRRRRPNLTKNLKLWDLLLDLEESLGTIQTTKDAYNRALEIKAATAQHVLHYAAFLVEHEYFEEAFQAYERGVELFSSNTGAAKLLWKSYLQQFMKRYHGSKVERTRDLFARCLEQCAPQDRAEFYTMHGAFEEQYGLTKRALSVYRDMCQAVSAASEKLTAYQLYIVKTTQYLGVTATRDIYQEAIQALDDDQSCAKICMDFAAMETSLQELDRARAIFTYGAQMADPRRLPEYWKAWNDFEIAHGNEETFREMLRVKRSVEAAFSTVNYNATGMTDKVETISQSEAMKMIASQEGVQLDTPKTAVAGFVSSSSKRTAAAANLANVEERVAKLRKATAASSSGENPDDNDEQRDQAEDTNDNDDDDEEIDIDDIDAEIEQAAAEGAAAGVEQVSTKAVPEAVFGGLAPQAAERTGDDAAGD